MRIKVRDKVTGQLGTIEDNELSSRYEKVSDPTPTPTTTPTPTAGKQKDVISQGQGLVESLISPFKKTGEMVVESGFQLARFLREPAFRKAVLNKDLSDKEAKDLVMARPSFWMDKEELEDIGKDPRKAAIKQAGRSAQMLSFGVGGGALAQGAKIGALQSVGQQLEDTQKLDPIQTLIGTGIGGVAGFGLGKVLGTKALTAFGQKMRKGVLNPQAKATIWFSKNVDQLVKAQKKLGLKGTSIQQLEQLPVKFDQVGKQITSLIKGKAIKDKVVSSSVNAELEKVAYEGTERTFTKEVNKLISRLGTKESYVATSIYNLKSNLRGELGQVFTKLAKGNNLVPKEAAKLAFYRGLKESLNTVSKKVGSLNKLQHTMDELATGLAKNVGKGGLRLPVVGQRFGETTQKIQDVTGRGAAAAGGGLENILGRVPEQIGGAGGITTTGLLQNILSGGVSNAQASQQQPQQVPTDLQQAAPTEAPAGIPQQQPIQQQQLVTPEIVMSAYLELPTAEAKKIKAIYDVQQELAIEDLSLSDGAIKIVNDLNGAILDVEGLTSSIENSDLIGPIKGFAAKYPWDIKGKSMQAEINRVRQVVGKALEGGVLRKEDEIKYKRILPTMLDTKPVALNKLQQLKEKITIDLENYKILQQSFGKGRSLENQAIPGLTSF